MTIEAKQTTPTIVGTFDQLDFLLGSLQSAVAVFDREMRYLMVNSRWIEDFRLTGIPLLGRTYYEVFSNTDDIWKEFHARVLSGETLVNHEDRIERIDGSSLYLSWQLFPWYKEENLAPAGLVMVTQDITTVVTTQLQREINLTEGIQKARKRAETLANISGDLSKAADEQEILNAISVLAEQYQVTISALSYAVVDENGYPYGSDAVAMRTGNGQVFPLSKLPSTFLPRKGSPVLEVVYNTPDEPVFVEDVDNDPRYNTPESIAYMKATGILAAILLPLKTTDQWHGIFTFAFSSPRKFDADLRDLFIAIKPTLVSVVARRRAYLAEEALRQRAETLAKISTALSQATDEQEILQAVSVLAEHYHVTMSALSYSVADDQGVPYGSNAVALRSGDGQVLPLSILPTPFTPRETSPFLDLAFQHPDEPTFIEDASAPSEENTPETRAYMQATNIKSAILLPLRTGNQWHGIFTFAWQNATMFPPELRDLFIAIRPTLASVVASRRLYLQTLENLDKLKELDRLKNEFMSTMSHELRTPLNAVIGLGDIILAGLDGELPPKAESDIQTMFNAGQQLLGIVNDILDIAKIESGRLDLILSPVRLLDPITEAVETTHVLVENKHLNLMLNVPADLPTVLGDTTRLRQVVLNLLSNAIKFTEQGTVEISALAKDNMIVVCVRDEGIGIDPKHHQLVFEHFRQVEGAITRKKGGTGLGLPISKKLIELHGGEMWLESALGQGSKFYFSLPINLGGTK